jgi:cytochrome o ubiquinol oxidase subunit 2
MHILKNLRRSLLLLSAMLLAGCNTVLMNPSGDIANQQGRLIVVSTVLMLIIIIPVIALTIFFAWRYRQSNKEATYSPDWDHSTQLELAIWAAPLLIIIALGAITWISTHTLDPYQPLRRLDAQRAIPAETKPLVVEVVALDWKWLFIYPDLGIATVNQLAFPVGTPVNFRITSDSVMNSFFIPQLGSQIYAMAGMQTRLHLVADHAGDFAGVSANYSGHGYADMKFRALAKTPAQFDAWVAGVKASADRLDMNAYNVVTQPSTNQPVRYFSTVDSKLFRNIIAKYNNGNVLDFKDAACATQG